MEPLALLGPGRHAWHPFIGLSRRDRVAADPDVTLVALRAEGIGTRRSDQDDVRRALDKVFAHYGRA